MTSTNFLYFKHSSNFNQLNRENKQYLFVRVNKGWYYCSLLSANMEATLKRHHIDPDHKTYIFKGTMASFKKCIPSSPIRDIGIVGEIVCSYSNN